MKLQDQLYDAVADVSADLPTLAASSRSRGLSIRRRRQALTSVGAAAAVAAVAVSGLLLRPGADEPRGSDPGYASELALRPLSGATVPNTGRATAAALLAAVARVAEGTATRIQGGDPSPDTIPPDKESLATFMFTPADGSGPGVVFLNLQPIDAVYDQVCPAGTKDCRTVPTTSWGCESYMVGCVVSKTAAGDTLRTYRDTESDAGDDDVRLVAEVISPARGLRLVLSAANNHGEESAATRPDAVLTLPQLVDVATQPWWGFRLPAEYAGTDLRGYHGTGGAIDAVAPTPQG
jgi:hypothetical protein